MSVIIDDRADVWEEASRRALMQVGVSTKNRHFSCMELFLLRNCGQLRAVTYADVREEASRRALMQVSARENPHQLACGCFPRSLLRPDCSLLSALSCSVFSATVCAEKVMYPHYFTLLHANCCCAAGDALPPPLGGSCTRLRSSNAYTDHSPCYCFVFPLLHCCR
jgi:hypothetical protein